MESHDINLNQAQCMVYRVEWGYDRYVNICNGIEKIVDWGFAEWFLAIAVASLVIFAMVFTLYAFWKIIVDN